MKDGLVANRGDRILIATRNHDLVAGALKEILARPGIQPTWLPYREIEESNGIPIARSNGCNGVAILPGHDEYRQPNRQGGLCPNHYSCIDSGINFIDTADSYNDGEAERIIGSALRENGRRDKVVLATKVHIRWEPAERPRRFTFPHFPSLREFTPPLADGPD
jgi:hypothetical protein